MTHEDHRELFGLISLVKRLCPSDVGLLYQLAQCLERTPSDDPGYHPGGPTTSRPGEVVLLQAQARRSA